METDDDDIDSFLAATGITVGATSREPVWRNEWQGMPEFVQEQLPEAYAEYVLRFANPEDMADFERRTGLRLPRAKTTKRHGVWYPPLERGANRTIGRLGHKLYVEESTEPEDEGEP